ncbi:MAG: hypothetical protein A4E62_02784 [Syntrophorhabdus sp. PtaU1.Bin002]|nr:MAG: hypothetical protein A4E62_02784 [Syntrophorhabdus sp. PtaU1.Bin002]
MRRLCTEGSRSLIRGDLSDMHQVGRVSAIIGNPEAPYVATQRVSRQKSAEGIVCAGQRTDQEG